MIHESLGNLELMMSRILPCVNAGIVSIQFPGSNHGGNYKIFLRGDYQRIYCFKAVLN